MGDESSLIRTSAVVPPVTASLFNPFAHPIVEVKVAELKFISDHSILVDNNANWENSGSRFPKPEWTYGKASQPITHSKKKEVIVEVTFDVYPTNGDLISNCTLTGKADFSSLAFSVTGVDLKGGRMTLRTTSTNTLDDKVQKLTGKIDWNFAAPSGQNFSAGASWGHTIYVTYGRPNDAATHAEKGITQKRMEAAVNLVNGGNDPHAIVAALAKSLPGYTLIKDPAVPANYAHPGYRAPDQQGAAVGAWPFAEFSAKAAECQGMARFIRGVLDQVGAPPAEVVVVFADPDIGGGATAQVEPWETSKGLNKSKTVKGVLWEAMLAANDPVAVGKVFDLNDSSRADYMGANKFEACLKFSYNGITHYYPAGVSGSVYDTPEPILGVFSALCWVEFFTDPKGLDKLRILQIVKHY